MSLHHLPKEAKLDTYLQYLLAAVIAYLIGSFPTGVIAAKLKGAPDVRYSGSKHTGGTNTMRLTGPWIGAAVVVIDGLKGLVAWGAAYIITRGSPYALPIAGMMAVIGHCWPIYTRFHGGMGLATGGGLILVLSPLTIAMGLLIWATLFLGVFKKRYSHRCVAIALPLAVITTVFFISQSANIEWMMALVTPVLIIKHIPEWNRIA